jgi:hypothetical protein
MKSFTPIAAAILALAALPALAGVYRWVDKDGHVHYTDKAEPHAEQINVHTGQIRGSDTLDPNAPSTNLTGDALVAKQAECEQKKKQYESYRTAVKIVETDSLGRKHEYTPEEQKQLTARALQEMQDICTLAGVSVSAGTPSSSTP